MSFNQGIQRPGAVNDIEMSVSQSKSLEDSVEAMASDKEDLEKNNKSNNIGSSEVS